MWETVPLVTTGVALVAFLAAAALWAWMAHAARARKLIETAPESDRGKLVAQALESFAIDTGRLTRDQQFQLAVQQIGARERRFRLGIIALVVVGVLTAAVAVAAMFGAKPPDRAPAADPAQKPERVDDVEISDIGFLDHSSDARAPRLDVKLANRGTRLAFVKAVRLEVKKAWGLQPLPQLPQVVVPPSHDYKVLLVPGKGPETYRLKVSHGIRVEEADRFTVQIEEDPWAGGNSIYLIRVEIVANADDKVFPSKDLLCVITQYGAELPDRAWVKWMADKMQQRGHVLDEQAAVAAIRANRDTVLEVAKVPGVRSPSLERMIESARKTDVK